MGMLTRAMTAGLQAAAPGPADDFWYRPIGGASATGVRVSMETALKVSAVWACVSLIADSLGMLPIHFFQKQARGRLLADRHPLNVVLGDRPNERMTPFDFKAMVTAHALLSHGGYAEIVPGALGAVTQLRPLDSRWVTPEPLPGDRVRFVVREPGQERRTINQESMFRIQGLSLDGFVGMSVADRLAVEAIGLALATERYGAAFFGRGARPSLVLKHPGRLTPEAAAELRDYFSSEHGGLENAHRPMVAEEGMDVTVVSSANEEAQFVETREFQMADLARWFRVPPHLIGVMEKSTTWGTGIEAMGQGFVTFTLAPWFTRWEEAIGRDLITESTRFYAKFVPAALLRGATLDRYQAHQIAAGGNAPWMTINEVRALEDLNPMPGADQLRTPLNMGPAVGGSDGATMMPAATRPELVRALVRQVAYALVRTEVVAMTKAAKRCASDGEAWRAAVTDFYRDHAVAMAEALHLPVGAAHGYAVLQSMALISHGVETMADWETNRVESLVRMALGERQGDAIRAGSDAGVGDPLGGAAGDGPADGGHPGPAGGR